MVFPTFFNFSLNLALRSSWAEPQSAPGLVFDDCIDLVGRTLPANAGDKGSVPGLSRSTCHREAKPAHLSCHALTLELWAAIRETTAKSSQHSSTKSQPRSPHMHSNGDPAQPKTSYFLKNKEKKKPNSHFWEKETKMASKFCKIHLHSISKNAKPTRYQFMPNWLSNFIIYHYYVW